MNCRRLLYPATAVLLGIAWLLCMRAVPALPGIESLMRSGLEPLIAFIATSVLVSILFRRRIVGGHALRVFIVSLTLTLVGSVVFMELMFGISMLFAKDADDGGNFSLSARILAPAAAGIFGTLTLAPATVPMGIASVLALRWAHRHSASQSERPTSSPRPRAPSSAP
jgi:hypothetical protein